LPAFEVVVFRAFPAFLILASPLLVIMHGWQAAAATLPLIGHPRKVLGSLIWVTVLGSLISGTSQRLTCWTSDPRSGQTTHTHQCRRVSARRKGRGQGLGRRKGRGLGRRGQGLGRRGQGQGEEPAVPTATGTKAKLTALVCPCQQQPVEAGGIAARASQRPKGACDRWTKRTSERARAGQGRAGTKVGALLDVSAGGEGLGAREDLVEQHLPRCSHPTTPRAQRGHVITSPRLVAV
jgi:hypothetical protein